MIAHRLRQPVILGYLVIGMAIGPHALGLIGDIELVQGAATIGVALMMLTLGLEVSFTQLRQVGKVGLWGGAAQIVITFALGTLMGVALFRWPFAEAATFGLAISLSSTMIGLKTLMDRGELDAPHGRIMMAILILQDISVVLMMVVTPVLGGTGQNLLLALATAGAVAVLSIGAATALGIWGLPWLMGRVGGVRSRELFLLTVLVLSLGAALSTQIFGLSAVFGAFLIGLVLRETKFAHQALAEITPLRDIFAALFFVSLGMLLDPRFVAEQWQLVAATVLLIIFTKTLVVSTIVRGFGYSGRTALLSGAGLFQIGEFSFILAAGGVSSGIVSDHVYSLLLACAIITMLLTPPALGLASGLYYRVAPRAIGGATEAKTGPRLPGAEIDKAAVPVVLAGFGAIGVKIARGLENAGIPYTVIEIDPEVINDIRCRGAACVYGDASNTHVLSRLDLSQARVLVITFPDPLAVLTTAKAALALNPQLRVIARVHREKDAEELRKLGAVELVSPEYEASLEFLSKTLGVSGLKETEAKRALAAIRLDEKIAEFSPEKQD